MPRKISRENPTGPAGAVASDWREAFRENIQRELDARHMDMRQLSRLAGLGDTYVRDAIVRGRGGSLDAVTRIAAALGLTVETLTTRKDQKQLSRLNAPITIERHIDTPANSAVTIRPVAQPLRNKPQSGLKIRVVGDVAAGVWTEIEAVQIADDDLPESHLPPDPRWPAQCQYDLVVKGTSLNRVARDGDYLRCVDIPTTGIAVRDGDLVVVRRLRGGMVETTCKRAKRNGDTIEYWPDSTDPRWQEPISIESDDPSTTVDLIGLVLYAYAPLASGHRGGGGRIPI